MHTKARARRPLTVILAILAAVAAGVYLWWLVRDSDFDAQRFWNTFTGLHYGWLTLGIGLMLLTYIGRVLRWQVMMRPFVPNPRFGRMLAATVIGFTGIVLFGRPGELIRPYLISVRERTSFTSQMAIWLLERIWDLLVVLAVFGFALTQVKVDPSTVSPAMQWVLRTGGFFVAGLCTVCVGILVFMGIFHDTAERRIQAALPGLPDALRQRIEPVLLAFIGGMKCSRSGLSVLQILGYSVAEWVIIVGSIWCLLRSFPQTSTFTLVDGAVYTGFVAFGSVVQLPGIGGGMQVASVLVLTQLFGLDSASATGAAVLIWLTMYVFVVPFGVALAIHEGIKWRDISHLKADKLS